MNLRVFIALLLSVLLAGCAGIPQAPMTTQAWQLQQARLATLSSWSLQGRVAIHTADDGGNVSLQWHQREEAYELLFQAPLGQGSLRLTGSAAGVMARDDEGRLAVASDAEALIADMTGWRIPVEHLRYWVLGRVEPQDDYELDELGRLKQLRRGGWQVEYQRYARFGELFLPTKLKLEHQQVKIRMVVDQWRLDDALGEAGRGT